MSESTLNAAWKGHPSTRKLRKHLEGQRRLALEAIMNKAKVSADPEIREAYARHEALSMALWHVTPQQGEGEDE